MGERSIREYGRRSIQGWGKAAPSCRSAWAPVRSSGAVHNRSVLNGGHGVQDPRPRSTIAPGGWAAVPGNRHGRRSLRGGPYVLLEAVSNGGHPEPGTLVVGARSGLRLQRGRAPRRGGRPTSGTDPRSGAHRGAFPRRSGGLPARRRHRNEPQTNLHRRGGGRGGREYGEAERPHEATAHMNAGTLVDDDSPLFSRTYRQTTERDRVRMRPSRLLPEQHQVFWEAYGVQITI